MSAIRFKSFPELRQLVDEHARTASLSNLLAMVSRLKAVPNATGPELVGLLGRLWDVLRPQLAAAQPRHCAEAMLTASKLQAAPPGLYQECMAALVSGLDNALQAGGGRGRSGTARVVSNAIYAVAAAPPGAVRAGDGVREAVERRLLPAFHSLLPDVQPQTVANAAYSAAVLRLDGLDLRQMLRRLPRGFWRAASTQEVSNTLWAAAQLSQPLDEEQVQLLVNSLIAKASEAKPQHVTNTMWAAAQLGQRLPPQHVRTLLAVLRRQPYARAFAMALWSVAKVGDTLPQRQVERLLDLLLADLRSGSAARGDQDQGAGHPQAISNAMWSVATMGLRAPAHQVSALVDALVARLPQSTPQVIANTLWGAATMGARLSQQQLGPIFDELTSQLPRAEPQAVANALWAAASLLPPYKPCGLLAPGARDHIVRKLLPSSKPQEASNMALACALLGHDDRELLGPLLERGVALMDEQLAAERDAAASGGGGAATTSTGTSFDTQAACNMAWAYAVLDVRGTAQQLQRFAQFLVRRWPRLGTEDKVQLFQLHLWLLDTAAAQRGAGGGGGGDAGGGGGLLGVVSDEQLAELASSWDHTLQGIVHSSGLQRAVHAAAQLVPALEHAQLETRTPDGLFSADILALARRRDGREVHVVIEVDGPWHFTVPDLAPTGPTSYRNRALLARGLALVVVPWWEWEEVGGGGGGPAAAEDAGRPAPDAAGPAEGAGADAQPADEVVRRRVEYLEAKVQQALDAHEAAERAAEAVAAAAAGQPLV